MLRDLEFQDFLDIYEEDIYCAYMESGSYYDTDKEKFDEAEYEEYLRGEGQWACTSKPFDLDTPIKV